MAYQKLIVVDPKHSLLAHSNNRDNSLDRSFEGTGIVVVPANGARFCTEALCSGRKHVIGIIVPVSAIEGSIHNWIREVRSVYGFYGNVVVVANEHVSIEDPATYVFMCSGRETLVGLLGRLFLPERKAAKIPAQEAIAV